MNRSSPQATEAPGSGQATMACPTCRAEQDWSNECRRCRSDLTDLHSVWRRRRELRTACLDALRIGGLERALDLARDGVSLCPNEESTRLLTVCHLLLGHWSAAQQAAGGDRGASSSRSRGGAQ